MKRISMMVLSAALLGGAAYAKPAKNISASKHPNLAAAQDLSAKAYAKLSAAQSANEFDMSGHAAKAKELLEQANSEMKQAAEAANQAAKQ